VSEIKFRGKRIDNGEWAYGDLRQIESHCYIMDYDIGDDGISQISKIFDLHFEVDPSTVGQYTGLHDKNGKEIFEGQYIYVPYNHLGFVKVKFEDGCFNISGYALTKCTVFDNPELLNSQKQKSEE